MRLKYIEEIRLNYKALVELDFTFAKGALALDMNASRPVFNTEGRIRIREGRHPLLDRKKVVPISLTLGDTFDLLVITGRTQVVRPFPSRLWGFLP